jgi:hypothetical protein
MFSKNLGFKFVVVGPKCNVVFDDGGISKFFEDTPFIPSRKANLLQALKETMQKPPLGPFQRSNIVWLPHVTGGNGLYTNDEIAIIPLDHLKDFLEEEHNNPNLAGL